MPSRAVVRTAGEALRLPAQTMQYEFAQAPSAAHLLLRYTQALITQVAQAAACNRHHSLDQRLCRWLLMDLDRVQGNELVATQEQIADMLGVRREGVTECALRLQSLGLIRYARGHILVVDRMGLEKQACECYAMVKKEYERLLLPQTTAPGPAGDCGGTCRSGDCTEQRPHACGDRHGQRAPEADAPCGRQDACPASPCGNGAQQGQESERHSRQQRHRPRGWPSTPGRRWRPAPRRAASLCARCDDVQCGGATISWTVVLVGRSLRRKQQQSHAGEQQ